MVEVLLSRLRPTELLPARSSGSGWSDWRSSRWWRESALVALKLSGNTVAPTTTPSTIGWILFWFILAYAFYAVLYAAAGSLVSRQEEAQSIQVPITAILLVGYFFALRGCAVARRRRGGHRIVVPPDGPDGDDRPHGGGRRPRVADRCCRWR